MALVTTFRLTFSVGVSSPFSWVRSSGRITKRLICSTGPTWEFTSSTTFWTSARISSDSGSSPTSSPCSDAKAGASSGSSVISAMRYGRRSPTTTAWEIQRFCLSPFSRLAGVMFLPPAVMMMSFLRPVMKT